MTCPGASGGSSTRKDNTNGSFDCALHLCQWRSPPARRPNPRRDDATRSGSSPARRRLRTAATAHCQREVKTSTACPVNIWQSRPVIPHPYHSYPCKKLLSW